MSDIFTAITSLVMMFALLLFLSKIEPFCYYIPGSLKQFYKVHTNVKTKFKDIIGCDEVKQELEILIDMFKSQHVVSKGCVFVGSPGTGKTMMARAIAGETDLPFVEVYTSSIMDSHIPTVINKVVKKHSPCIIFIDECDKILETCGDTLLRKIDGIDSMEKVVLIMATSVGVPKSVSRSGRLDRIISFVPPTPKERIKFFQQMKFENSEELAAMTQGFTQADLSIIPREIKALKFNNNKLTDRDLIYKVIDKLKFGRQTNKHEIPHHIKSRVAYHEIGHALMSHALRESSTPSKISVDNVKSMLGRTEFINSNKINIQMGSPIETTKTHDNLNNTTSDLLKRICVLLASSIFEQQYCGEHSTACEDDFKTINLILGQMYNCNMLTWDNLDITSEHKYQTKIKKELFKIFQGIIENFIVDHQELISEIYQELIIKSVLDKDDISRIIKDKIHYYVDLKWNNESLIVHTIVPAIS